MDKGKRHEDLRAPELCVRLDWPGGLLGFRREPKSLQENAETLQETPKLIPNSIKLSFQILAGWMLVGFLRGKSAGTLSAECRPQNVAWPGQRLEAAQVLLTSLILDVPKNPVDGHNVVYGGAGSDVPHTFGSISWEPSLDNT